MRNALLALATALLAAAGMTGIWCAAALLLKSPCGWMALVVAVDVALMMRLSGLPSGTGRAATATAATLLTLATGAFAVAGVRIGHAFGEVPHLAVWRIDLPLALTWWRLNFSAFDALAAALALPLAWRLGR